MGMMSDYKPTDICKGDCKLYEMSKRIDELESLLREACDLEFKGACYACESVAETNIKLQKRINELEAKIKHW